MNFNKQRRNFTFNRPSVERSVSPRERSASPRSSSPAPSLSTIAKEVKWSNKFRLSFAPTPKPIVNDVHSSGHSSLATVNNGVNETILDNTNPFLSRSPTLAELSKGPFVKTPSPKVAPVAMSDFLSRESEILGGEFAKAAPSLGGDEIDFDRAASAFPDISLDGTGDIPTPVVPALSRGATQVDDFGFDDFTSAPPVRDVKITGGDEIDRFEDQFPDLDDGAHVETYSPVVQQPTFGAQAPFAPRPQPSALNSTPILHQPLPDENEPEVIRQWREKRDAECKARDDASAARREETIRKAERSIDKFYEEYNAKKERNIKDNKQQEAEYLASFSDNLSAGTTWSRICDYIELQNSQSKTLARNGAGTTDLSRFKEVLLRLKREGDAAPGAAGY